MARRDRASRVEAVVLPGGFSYGDYLRAGAIARFAPAMDAVAEFAREGGPVLGICNGFQILCGQAFFRASCGRTRRSRSSAATFRVVVERDDTLFTARCQRGQELVIPVKHGDGCYQAPAELPAAQVVLRYAPQRTRTAPTATSPRWPTPTETSWASCPIRNMRWTRCSDRGTER